VTYLLLASTAIIQLYISVLSAPEALGVYEEHALYPIRLLNGIGIDGLVTYMFIHGSLMHFLVNAIALWGAGGIVEREIGPSRYALVYMLSGVAAGLTHSLLNPRSATPLVGASGAIFGVIAVLFLLMPFKIAFALVIPLPSVLIGIILSAAEFSALWLPSEALVAHDAHLAGFIFGGLSAFAIDGRRALKGLTIAAAVFAVLCLLGFYFGLI